MKEKNRKNFIKDRRTNQIVKEKETLENTHEFEIRHSTMYIYIYIIKFRVLQGKVNDEGVGISSISTVSFSV
jgi:hypothetical protein